MVFTRPPSEVLRKASALIEHLLRSEQRELARLASDIHGGPGELDELAELGPDIAPLIAERLCTSVRPCDRVYALGVLERLERRRDGFTPVHSFIYKMARQDENPYVRMESLRHLVNHPLSGEIHFPKMSQSVRSSLSFILTNGAVSIRRKGLLLVWDLAEGGQSDLAQQCLDYLPEAEEAPECVYAAARLSRLLKPTKRVGRRLLQWTSCQPPENVQECFETVMAWLGKSPETSAFVTGIRDADDSMKREEIIQQFGNRLERLNWD